MSKMSQSQGKHPTYKHRRQIRHKESNCVEVISYLASRSAWGGRQGCDWGKEEHGGHIVAHGI